MLESPIAWPTIVTAAVALYGAVLSTVNLIVGRKERRRQVQVRFGQAVSLVPLLNTPVDLLSMEAVNVGSRPVTLNAPTILLPTRDRVFFPRFWHGSSSFPCELSDSAKCTALIEVAALADAFRQKGLTGRVRLVGVFKDSAGKEHKSRPVHVDAELAYKAAEEVTRIGP